MFECVFIKPQVKERKRPTCSNDSCLRHMHTCPFHLTAAPDGV